MQVKFKFSGISGTVDLTPSGMWVQWGGASFWATAAKGGLRDAINAAVIKALEGGKA